MVHLKGFSSHYLDPVTLEWVFPDGRRMSSIRGGSATVHDEVEGKRTEMDIDLDEPDEEDEEQDRDEREDEEDDRRDPDEYVSRADHERIKTALKRERRDRKKLKTEYEDKISKLTSESTESSVIEVEKAKIAVTKERDSYWSEQIVRARAATEFAAQGASSSNAERLAGLVDMKKIEYDEKDREFDGLEEEIEDIMAENQDFFRKTKDVEEEPTSRRLPRPPVDGATRGKRGGGGTRQKTSTAELLARRALGRQPRRQT